MMPRQHRRLGCSAENGEAAVTIVFADLGDWAGATLIAEYDPEDDAIRIDRQAVARIRARLGEIECERFIACAIAHERYHREHPAASETEALAWADRTSGCGSARYARALSERR
jgi:hypothetical protein